MTYLPRFIALCAGIACILPSADASARPFRVSDIPNGSKYGCLNCHGDTKASYNTDFGSDARLFLTGAGTPQEQHVDWTPLCPLDSDRDGWTNGEELGDPDCTWKVGDPSPMGFLYNPGNPESAPPPVCGSGALEAFEACDGTLLAYADCAAAGAGTGPLSCTVDCKLDYSACSEPPGSMPDISVNPVADESGGCAVAKGARGRDGAWLVSLLVAGAAVLRGRRRSSSEPRLQ